MPRLNKTLKFCVRFARFMQENNLDPFAAAEIVALANAAFAAGVRDCNIPDQHEQNERAHERLRAYVEPLGFGVEFDGLWPTLTRDGRDIRIPNED